METFLVFVREKMCDANEVQCFNLTKNRVNFPLIIYEKQMTTKRTWESKYKVQYKIKSLTLLVHFEQIICKERNNSLFLNKY